MKLSTSNQQPDDPGPTRSILVWNVIPTSQCNTTHIPDKIFDSGRSEVPGTILQTKSDPGDDSSSLKTNGMKTKNPRYVIPRVNQVTPNSSPPYCERKSNSSCLFTPHE